MEWLSTSYSYFGKVWNPYDCLAHFDHQNFEPLILHFFLLLISVVHLVLDLLKLLNDFVLSFTVKLWLHRCQSLTGVTQYLLQQTAFLNKIKSTHQTFLKFERISPPLKFILHLMSSSTSNTFRGSWINLSKESFPPSVTFSYSHRLS